MVKYPPPIQRVIAPVLQLFYNRQGGFLWLKMDCGSLYKTKRKPLYYLIFQAIQGFSLLAEMSGTLYMSLFHFSQDCKSENCSRKEIIVRIILEWWAIKDSNLGPTGYEPVALTN